MLGHSSLNHVYRTVWNEALGAMVAVAEHVSSHAGRAGRRVAVGAAYGALAPQGALTPLALVVALVCCGAALPVQANPQGGVAIHGQATFNTAQPNVLQVTTQNGAGTNHSAINWQSFSIPAGSTTQILQPNAASMSINRVVTNTPSVLFGSLQSNGQVVLVNQAGIAVGSGAVVDTAGFTASAVGMSAADAVLGRLRFAGDGFTGTSGALTVQGNIIARGGDVVLIAPSVEVAQSAVVESQGGSVVLAAGQSVEVTGRGLEGITLQVQAPSDQALNLGSLKGDAVGIFASTLKHSGQIQATTATLEGGRVVLKAAGDAYVQGSGRIDASSTTGKGGGIAVLGNRVAVMDNAVLDASGATGGGTVLVGGDYQGKNPDIPNAQVSYFGANATVRADATDKGDGGKVIVWADDTTRAYGHISARGGINGGNGGFIENSGMRYLDFRGVTDTGAPRGLAGQLLLDPNDIHIDNSVDSFAGGSFGGGIFSGGTGNPTITWATINLQSGSLEIRTNSAAGSGFGDIYLDASGTLAGPTTLTLLANRGINFGGGVVFNAGSANVNLVAGWNNSGWAVSPGAGKDVSFGINSSLVTSGNVWMNAGNAVSAINSTASVAANILTLGNTNPSSLPGGVSLPGTNMVNTLAVRSDGGGALTFKNGKALTVGAGEFGINGVGASGNPQAINIETTVGDLTVANAIVSDVLGGAPITLKAVGALNINSAVTSTFNATPNGPILLKAGASGISSNASGVITTNTLEVISDGTVTLNAPNVVTTLAADVTGSGLSFTNSSGFSVGVAGGTTGVTVASGDVSLTTSSANQLLAISNNVQATTGNVIYITDNLAHNAFTTTSGSAGKFVEVRPFTAATAIEFSGTGDGLGFLRLSSGELSFSTPMLKLGHNSNTGGINFAQAVTPANFNTLSLITGGVISQTGGSVLTIANVNADGAAGVAMGTEANVVTGKLGGHTATGNFAFKTTGSVVLEQVDVNNGINSTSGNITLDVGGSVSEGGTAILSTPAAVTVTSGTGLALNNNNTGSVVALNNLTSGNLSFVANTASVSMSATNVGAGTISLSNVAGAGTLTLGNAATASGAVTVSAPGNVTLGTVSTSGTVSIASSAASIVDGNTGTLNITGGQIDVTGASGIASSGDPLEVNPSVKVNAQSSAGSIYLAASSDLNLGLVSASGTASLSSFSGSILDANGATNNISAASAILSAYSGIGVGDALETQLGSLSASTNMYGDIVIDNSGTLTLGTLSTGGTGYRWLIYAASPANVVKGSVTTNFRHYSAAYSTYPSPSESGNGLIYASAPGTLLVDTILSSGSPNHVYGSSPTALYGYSISNASIADNEDYALTSGTVSYSPFISSATNAGSYSVQYGGGLSSSAGYLFAPGVGVGYTVTPAPILVAPVTPSVSASLMGSVTKAYDGTTAAALTPDNFMLSGFIGGDSATVIKTSGTYVSKDVGTNIGVTASLASTDFVAGGSTLLSNYTLPTFAKGNVGIIMPKPLSLAPTVANKVYDATVAATIISYGLSGFVAGELVKASSTSAVFDDKEVGVSKNVTISGISLLDDTGLAANYSVSGTATAAADITAVPVVAPPLTVPPVTPPSTQINATDYVAVFQEKFEQAVQGGDAFTGLTSRLPAVKPAQNVNGVGDKDKEKERDKLRARDNIVLEGETCKP